MAKRAPKRRGRRDKLSVHTRAEFLQALRDSCNVSAAARAVGHPRQSWYLIRKNDPDFAAEWDDAVDEATDALEAEARRRAMDGCDRPIYQRGELVGYERQYSDTLMCLLLKAHRPMTFRDRVEHDLGPQAASTIADLVKRANVERDRNSG